MPLLSLRGVTRTYPGPAPIEALRSVDLDVSEGDFLAIQGPSGTGKSTLLNILGLLDRPSSGVYRIQGIETTSLRGTEIDGLRASVFGFIFQAAHMLPDRTIAQNVALGLQTRHDPFGDREAQVRAALEVVGLGHRARAIARNVSGGEQQRAAIARALATRPRVILADEPTGALDADNARRLIETLHDVNDRGITVVVISHNDDVAAAARSRAWLADGQLTWL